MTTCAKVQLGIASAFVLAASVLAPSQTLAAVVAPKTIAQTDKLVVSDVTYQPGDTSPVLVRKGQVVHILTGGTLQREFKDGTKASFNRKAGDTYVVDEARPYSSTNTGKTAVHLIAISPK